uniref:Shaggy-related protein kinase theta n=1 Tax=Rhizophora mucronata TaxID=61149 RepID=A0A2P2Q1B5_RHIMU
MDGSCIKHTKIEFVFPTQSTILHSSVFISCMLWNETSTQLSTCTSQLLSGKIEQRW